MFTGKEWEKAQTTRRNNNGDYVQLEAQGGNRIMDVGVDGKE